MKRKIFSLFAAAVLLFNMGLIHIYAVEPETPVPNITDILIGEVDYSAAATFTFHVELQGTNLSEEAAVFFKDSTDPAESGFGRVQVLQGDDINAEKTSGQTFVIGETPISPITLIAYTSVNGGETWTKWENKTIIVNPVTPVISSISIDGGEMVHSGTMLTAEVQGSHLNSSIQFSGNWNGSDVVSLSSINPEKTTAAFTLDLPENQTDKAIVYRIQYKVGEEEWQDAKEILVRTAESGTDLQVSNTSFPSGGGTVNVSANADGMGRIEGIRFSLIDRNGYDVMTPVEVPADENDEEIYTASASLTIPENTSTAAKTYFLAVTFQLNWWDGEAEWAGIDQDIQITVAGKPSSFSNENSSDDSSHTASGSPEKVQETYTADVISKANSRQTAVNIQNILAFGDAAEKTTPIQLAELKADDRNVQVNIVPQRLPSNVSSEQIQTVLDAVSSVNFSKTPAEVKDTIDKAVQDAEADVLYVNFALPKHVEFGFDVQITVPTSFAQGTGCYLYYWNDSTKNYEQVDDFAIDENGNATFSISHCSDYFIANKQLTGGLSAGESSSESAVDVIAAAETSVTETTTATETAANPKTGNTAPYALILVALAGCGVLVRGKIKR